MLGRMTRALALLGMLLGVGGLLLAADVSGKWNFDVQLDAGSGSPTFFFEQAGEKLSGKYQGQFGEQKLTGTVKGSSIRFSFTLSQGGESLEVVYEGTIESNGSMKGKVNYGTMASGTWTAKKAS